MSNITGFIIVSIISAVIAYHIIVVTWRILKVMIMINVIKGVKVYQVNDYKNIENTIYFYKGKREYYIDYLFGFIPYFNPLYVKIGYAKNPVQRLRSQRTSVGAYGYTLYGIINVEDRKQAETVVHDYFDGYRISTRNEWFRLSLDAWLYIMICKDDKLTDYVARKLAIEEK